MVTQEQESVDELHLVYKVVLSLREDVKDVNTKFDGLSKQVGEFTAYMIRAQALEQDRNLPGKIEDHDKRIDALERENAGQVKALKAIAGLLSLVSVILGIWLAIAQLRGGK
jgi:hypothetical protein